MIRIRPAAAAALVLAASSGAPAHASGCDAAGAVPIRFGGAVPLPAKVRGSYTVTLAKGEGVWIDVTAPEQSAEDEDRARGDAPPDVAVCGPEGRKLVPLPTDVFKDNADRSVLWADDEGKLRARFAAPAAGTYAIAIAPYDEPRTVALRRHAVAPLPPPPETIAYGTHRDIAIHDGAPVHFAFEGKAGEWVKITANSNWGEALTLAAPDRDGHYEQIDYKDIEYSDHPVIEHRLPASGTYLIEAGLGNVTASAKLHFTLDRIAAPPPAPNPPLLKPGETAAGTLPKGDNPVYYAIAVEPGRVYRLSLDAPFDGVLQLGSPEPLQPAEADDAFARRFTMLDESAPSGGKPLTWRFATALSGQLVLSVGGNDLVQGGPFTLSLSEEPR